MASFFIRQKETVGMLVSDEVVVYDDHYALVLKFKDDGKWRSQELYLGTDAFYKKLLEEREPNLALEHRINSLKTQIKKAEFDLTQAEFPSQVRTLNKREAHAKKALERAMRFREAVGKHG